MEMISCIQEAFSLYNYIDATLTQNKEHYMTLDMKAYRSMNAPTTTEREATTICLLEGMLRGHGYTIRSFGFPLGDDNEPLNYDELMIDAEKK